MARRVLAILVKEAQDITTNISVLPMYVMPIIFLLLFDRVSDQIIREWNAGFSLLFLLSIVGIYVPSMLVAEEKEKHTLQVLLLSPARPSEIYIGKGLITLISILLITLLIVILMSIPLVRLPALALLVLLCAAVCIPLGMAVGILSPNQMSTGLIGMPVYMGMVFAPMFAELSPAVGAVARFVPTHYFFQGAFGVMTGDAPWRPAAEAAGPLLVAAAIAFAVLVWIHKARMVAAD